MSVVPLPDRSRRRTLPGAARGFLPPICSTGTRTSGDG